MKDKAVRTGIDACGGTVEAQAVIIITVRSVPMRILVLIAALLLAIGPALACGNSQQSAASSSDQSVASSSQSTPTATPQSGQPKTADQQTKS